MCLQGVIVLSRQWKSVLYTPLLLDHNYKLRHPKPMNVSMPVPESDDEILASEGQSADDQEVTDECAVLIDTERGKTSEQKQFKGSLLLLTVAVILVCALIPNYIL